MQPTQPVVALIANAYVEQGVRPVALKVVLFEVIFIVVLVEVEFTSSV